MCFKGTRRLSLPNSLLKEIAKFVQKQTTNGFLKSLSAKDDRATQIENFYHQIEASVSSFQVSFDRRTRWSCGLYRILLYIDLSACEYSRLATAK